MSEQFRAKLDAKLAEYRSWSTGRRFKACRLVRYCGVDLLSVILLDVMEVQSRIESLVCEGFYVDWDALEDCLYLRVWEFGGPEPEWGKVFAEVRLDLPNQMFRQDGTGA